MAFYLGLYCLQKYNPFFGLVTVIVNNIDAYQLTKTNEFKYLHIRKIQLKERTSTTIHTSQMYESEFVQQPFTDSSMAGQLTNYIQC